MSKQKLKLTASQKQKFSRVRRLEQLHKMDPIEFEHYVGYLYKRDGYQVFTTVTSGDEGVDLHLKKGLRTIIVQCKRYKGTVGQPTVRDLYGAVSHENANAGVLVTTGSVSRPAEKWAQGKPITLIDGHALISWAKGKKIEVSATPTVSFNPLWLVGILLAGLLLWGGLQAWEARNNTSTPPTDTDSDTAVATTSTPVINSGEPQTLVSASELVGIGQFSETDNAMEKWERVPEYTVAYQDGLLTTSIATWQVGMSSEAFLVAVTVPSGGGRTEPQATVWLLSGDQSYHLDVTEGRLVHVESGEETAVSPTINRSTENGQFIELPIPLDILPSVERVGVQLETSSTLFTSNADFSAIDSETWNPLQ